VEIKRDFKSESSIRKKPKFRFKGSFWRKSRSVRMFLYSSFRKSILFFRKFNF